MTITPVRGKNTPGTGFSVTWNDGQFVMIVTGKGLVACGIVDFEVAEKFGFAMAIAHGTPDSPLVTVDDLLAAKVTEVTGKAADYGVRPGMTGQEALDALSD